MSGALAPSLKSLLALSMNRPLGVATGRAPAVLGANSNSAMLSSWFPASSKSPAPSVSVATPTAAPSITSIAETEFYTVSWAN